MKEEASRAGASSLSDDMSRSNAIASRNSLANRLSGTPPINTEERCVSESCARERLLKTDGREKSLRPFGSRKKLISSSKRTTTRNGVLGEKVGDSTEGFFEGAEEGASVVSGGIGSVGGIVDGERVEEGKKEGDEEGIEEGKSVSAHPKVGLLLGETVVSPTKLVGFDEAGVVELSIGSAGRSVGESVESVKL